jgi:hypothetical protein
LQISDCRFQIADLWQIADQSERQSAIRNLQLKCRASV